MKIKAIKDNSYREWEEIKIIEQCTEESLKEKYVYIGGNFYVKDTICRATDIVDAKGHTIYENDRLKPANYIAAELMSDEELEKATDPANYFSNPVVRWVPERSAFYLVSERILQTVPKIINTEKYIHADYEVDHIRTVRFVALTEDEAKHWVVYGNTIDNPDDTDYRVLPPKDADDFSSDS